MKQCCATPRNLTYKAFVGVGPAPSQPNPIRGCTRQYGVVRANYEVSQTRTTACVIGCQQKWPPTLLPTATLAGLKGIIETPDGTDDTSVSTGPAR